MSKYRGHRTVIKQLYKDTECGIKISESGDLFRMHGHKKIGTKTFYDISGGKKKFSLEVFENVAKVFNKEFKKRGKERKEVKAEDLIFEKIEKSSDIQTTLWTVKDSTDLIFTSERKKILYQISPDLNSVEHIETIFYNLKDNKKEFTNYHETEFSKTIDNLKKNAVINEAIFQLKLNGICLHFGTTSLPLLSYDKELISYDEGIFNYKSMAKMIDYDIILISKCVDNDPEINFDIENSLEELKEKIKNNELEYTDRERSDDDSFQINKFVIHFNEKIDLDLPTNIDSLSYEFKKNTHNYISDEELESLNKYWEKEKPRLDKLYGNIDLDNDQDNNNSNEKKFYKNMKLVEDSDEELLRIKEELKKISNKKKELEKILKDAKKN